MQSPIDTIPPHVTRRSPDPVDADVEAFNAAFEELDLAWRWDRGVIEALGAGDDRQKVSGFLQARCPHLLKVYDAEFLVELIVTTKAHWGKRAQ